MTERVGVIGLGVMGSAMAGNLLAAGHDVLGFDIEADRTASFVQRGGRAAQSAGGVAAESDLVVLSLPTVSALADVAAEIASNAHVDLVCLEAGTFPLEAKVSAHEPQGRELGAPTLGH